MRKIWQPAIALVAGGLAVAFVSPSAGAAEKAAPADSVAVHRLGAPAMTWTPEAMRDAIPLDRLLPKVDASKVTHDVRQGAPQIVRPVSSLLNEVAPMAFQDFDVATGAGLQNSVNSYKINLIPT
jgi:hypothetical protein